jgi:ankyrin repeat protein
MDNSGYIFDVWTAASVGDLEYVRDIIDDDIDEVNRGGWTCLMYASYYDHAQLVAFLLSSGSDAHAGKRTALMLAAACGHTDIIDVLVRVGGVGQDLDRDSKGFTALCHAVSSGHMDACHALLDAGSNVNVSVRSDLNALTPLLLAAQDGHERIVELLLRYGADPGYTATSGDNAISLALKQGHERIARFVKAKKATKVCPGVWDGPAQAEQLMSMKKKPTAFPHDLPTLLRDLKLDKYQENFQNVTLEIFLEMSDDDLKTLGISLLGPRRKLTAAIEQLRF